MKTFNKMILLIAVIFFLGLGNLAQAVNITIDPVNYTGNYTILGIGTLSGIQNLDVAPGNYVFSLGENIPFSVDSLGNITVNDPDTLDTNGNTLILKNVTINIDPVNYQGTYTVGGVGTFSGFQSLVLVPGLYLGRCHLD